MNIQQQISARNKRESIFIALILLILLVLCLWKGHNTKTPDNVNMEEAFKPLIMSSMPAASIDVGKCYYDRGKTTNTCDVTVSTRTDFLASLKCSHNFNTKQTDCLLTESK